MGGIKPAPFNIFLIFMIIGGAMVIPAGMGLFARLFGQGDDAYGGGSFLRSAYYGSRFAGLAVFGLTGGILRGSIRVGKRITSKTKSKKSESSDSGDGGTGGNDKYTETPAPTGESGNTDLGGSDGSG